MLVICSSSKDQLPFYIYITANINVKKTRLFVINLKKIHIYKTAYLNDVIVTWRQDFELDVAADAVGADGAFDPEGDFAVGVADRKLGSAERPEKSRRRKVLKFSKKIPI